jgi:hypothetical protein
MAEVVEGCYCVVEVVEGGWHWVATPVVEGYRRCTVTLRALPALCCCAASELQLFEWLLVFS